MNTKHVSDRKERKELKRKARAEAPAKPKRAETVARGSRKRKVKQVTKGQTVRKR